MARCVRLSCTCVQAGWWQAGWLVILWRTKSFAELLRLRTLCWGPRVKYPQKRARDSYERLHRKSGTCAAKYQPETRFATRRFLFAALLLPRTKARTRQPQVLQLWTVRRSVRRRLGRPSPGRRRRPLSTCCGSCLPPFRGRCRNSCRLWRNW